ncbi:hypothetical protein RDV78_02595 [Bacillota bacterium LX-D]|nr:hypothetical protein [Bacillota bacterium LX-D]
MPGFFFNNKGVALLTVVAVMGVLLVIGSSILYIASTDSRLVYDYSNAPRAFYVAEAGADLAIEKWKSYIINLPEKKDDLGKPTGIIENANIDSFLNLLDNKLTLDTADSSRNVSGNPRYELEKVFRQSYNLNSNDQSLWLSYTCSQSGQLAKTVQGSNAHYLTLDIKANYQDSIADYRVVLWYYNNRNIGSYKGFGTASATDETH